MKRSDVLAIAGEYGLAPNKKLGQNFLIDAGYTEKILTALSLEKTDRVLEIGPGLGALTEHLVTRAGTVSAVEIDSGLARYLAPRFAPEKNFTLVHCDFLRLEQNREWYEGFTKIVSNLPYYCASEILFTIARDYRAEEIYVMIQKEMAERIVSPPGSKSYGALTVTLGFYFTVKKLFTVHQNAFYPRPDVASAFIRLERKRDLPLAGEALELFHTIVKSAFWGRRKTLYTALSDSPHLDYTREEVKAMLADAGINPDTRGEDLGIEEYIRLARREGGNE